MTVKLVGALLVALGLLAIYLLLGISKRQPQTRAKTTVKKYRLAHEYDNKGFSEKGQSEGILDIPAIADKPGARSDQLSNGSSHLPSNNQNCPPGDTF